MFIKELDLRSVAVSSSSAFNLLTFASSTSSTLQFHNNVLRGRKSWTAAKRDRLGFQFGGTRYALYSRNGKKNRIGATLSPFKMLITSTVTVLLRLTSHVILARPKNIDDGFITLAMVRCLRSNRDGGNSALIA